MVAIIITYKQLIGLLIIECGGGCPTNGHNIVIPET